MKRYLTGPASTGKTTQLTQQLVSLITSGTRPDRILVVVPQLQQGQRFRAALAQARGNTRGEPQIGTLYGLAQQHVSLFFPLIAAEVGFAGQAQEPTFINVEAAQFFLNQIIQPRMGDFDDLKMYRPRMLSQILDSMNKAALNGYALTELAPRLSAAWSGNASRLTSYQRMQDAALAYRDYCLGHNLLDFSLTMHVFTRHLLQARSYQDYVAARYRHVLADNIEEGTPALHDFLRLVLQTADTAVLVEDDPGGYRLFLGADVQSARSLRTRFEPDEIEHIPARSNPSPIAAFGTALMQQFTPQAGPRRPQPVVESSSSLNDPIETGSVKYWVQQIDWVVARILQQVEAGIAPNDIAVMAPYVEDVLRFELNERLQPHGIGVRSLRPSRPLFDHPVTRAMATFARLANPHWEQPMSGTELARALSICIENLDVIRAQLIAEAALRVSPNALPPLEDAAVWNRIGPRFQAPYAQLQQWLEPWRHRSLAQLSASRNVVYGQTSVGVSSTEILANDLPPLDVFWQHLFTERLSQPSFRFRSEVVPSTDINPVPEGAQDGAIVCDRLIRSARQFREVFEDAGIAEVESVNREVIPVLGLSERPTEWPSEDVNLAYLHLLSEGIMAAQYAPERAAVISTTTANEMDVAGKSATSATSTHSPPSPETNEILLSTVYAYLTADVRSRVQFWLDVGSSGWYERIYQPLTHPYVLSRSWNGLPWTEEDEHRSAQDMMRRIVGGLTVRCSDKLYLVNSQLSMGGQDEAGPLLRAVQRIVAPPL